ncbi:copper resistance CopC/CopD family protein [Streptomyces sp. NPDC002004]
MLFLAVTGVLIAGAAPASAHAALTASDPRQGAVVDRAPVQVQLTFSEKVAMSDGSVRVLDPAGKRVDTRKVTELGGTTYGVGLRRGLSDGTFTVAYQVVSADSHPVNGAFTFSVGAPSKTRVTLPDQAAGGGVVGGFYGFARYVAYAGFILLVGGAAFVLACWPRGAGVRPVQRLVVSGWVALTAATLAMLLMRGSYTGSGKVADIVDLSLLGQVLQTKTGAALVSRLLLLAAAALFIAVLFGAYARRDGDEGPVGAEGAESAESAESTLASKKDLAFGLAIGGTVVSAGLAATWALAEHASVGLQAGLAMPVDVLHLLAVAAWLGGLAALLVSLYRAPSIEASAVRRFSRVAFGAVVTLTATGIYQSWRQLGSWSALTDTTYGRLLLVKVGLVAVLVGIAWTSRRWTARLSERPSPEAAGTAVADEHTPDGPLSAAEASDDGDEVAASEARAAAKVPVPADAVASAKASVAEDSSAAAGIPASAKAPVPTDGSASTDASGPGEDRPVDTTRVAQLARQQAAVSAARARRLRDADRERSGLRRSVLAETGVAVVLLAVTTVLTSTEPGRTAEEAARANNVATQAAGPLHLKMPFDTGGQDGKGTVLVDLTPGRTGANEMHVYVERPNGRAFDVPEVKVSFTLAAKKLGPLPVAPDRIATGHWSANGVQVPMAGDWRIAVTVRTSDIDQVTVNKNAKIG